MADKRNGVCSPNDNQSRGGEFVDGSDERARDHESAIGGHESDFRRGKVLSAKAAMRAQLKTFGSGGTMNEPEKLIPLHGGYRHLKSFQVAQLAYGVTARFCDRYIVPPPPKGYGALLKSARDIIRKDDRLLSRQPMNGALLKRTGYSDEN